MDCDCAIRAVAKLERSLSMRCLLFAGDREGEPAQIVEAVALRAMRLLLRSPWSRKHP
jgi:hypothetical protein